MDSCSSCDELNSKLIEVYVRNWWDMYAVDFSRHTRLCGKCLLGWTIPAFRQDLGEWEFGLVEQFENDKHRILFDDEEHEWVKVDVSPFETYIRQFKKVQAWSPPHQYPPNDDFHTPERSDTTTLDHTNAMKPMKLEEDNSRSPTRGDFEISTTPPLSYPLSSSRNASLERHNRQPKSPPPRPIFRPSERPYHTPESSTRAYSNSAASTRYGYHPHRASPRTPRSARVSSVEKSNKAGPTDRDTRQNTNSASPDNSIARQREERRKASQRLWTIEEDWILRQTIESSDCQWKWPVIAKAIPGRSGKQCRERYLNHLKPSLKLDSWSLMEDARLYHVYHSAGSKWAMIAKLLPGRTDNSVKNRFHHLSRRLEKRFAHDDNNASAAATTQQLERKLLDSSLFQRIKVDNLELKCIVAHGIHKATPKAIQDVDDQKKVGPFRPCKSAGETCKRCNLQIPSTQTGRFVCETTLWCYTCAHISPHMGCGDLVRAVHLVGKLSEDQFQVIKM